MKLPYWGHQTARHCNRFCRTTGTDWYVWFRLQGWNIFECFLAGQIVWRANLGCHHNHKLLSLLSAACALSNLANLLAFAKKSGHSFVFNFVLLSLYLLSILENLCLAPHLYNVFTPFSFFCFILLYFYLFS